MDDEVKDADLSNGTEDGADTSDDGKELTVEELQEELAKERASKQKLYERAKKAEGFVRQPDGTWIKPPKEEPKPEVKDTNLTAQLSEELKLIAKGLSDEEIDQLKAISRGKAISLGDALKDPLFVSYQKEQREIERKEKAKLGASKGSGSEEKNEFRSGMTREEHKAAWMKAMGK